MTNRDRKSGSNTEARTNDGKFASGNPGKPRGARHRATQAAQELLDGETEALTRKAIDKALEGDTTALRLCLERLCPPRKDAPVSFTLPPLAGASDALTAVAAILHAVAAGELTPGEGSSLAGLVEAFRKAAEIENLERRIAELEAERK